MKPCYISFGAGTQSSALLLLSEQGVIKGIKGAIFADTGSEPQRVYDWMDFIKTKIKKVPIHIIKSDRYPLHEYAFKNSHNPVPLHGYVKNSNKPSMGRRSCTSLFKIYPIKSKIRELEGIKKYQRLAEDSIEVALGISKDEDHRAKPSRIKWIKNVFPLLEKGLYRGDCKKIVYNYFGKYPPSSACVFCPYLKNKEFEENKQNKKDWDMAVLFDKRCRDQNKKVVQFVHRSHVPLDQAEISDKSNQLGFLDSCEEAYCGL